MYQDCEVILTDYLDPVLKILEENINLNKKHCPKKMTTLKLDWNDYQVTEKFDVIIGSELIYSVSPLEKLAQLIKNFLNLEIGEFWMLMPDERMYGSKFLDIMKCLGFGHRVVTLDDDYYTCSPLEDVEKGDKQFFPLRELHFKLYIFTFNNQCCTE
jgi:hypothetical protein